MIYVIDKTGQPLMPTTRYGKIRHLLKNEKAKIINHCPFTIQLLYDSPGHTQPITLGVDAGSKIIGLSATTEMKELYASNIQLRTDIVDLLSTRRQNRRTRRNRLRYRKPRFNNRVHGKNKDWLAPSIEQKILSHFTVVENAHKILPITKIVVETASFDIQKIKNPQITGAEYQQGEQLDFWNVREYVLFRDGHKCQNPRCKHGKILNVHHIKSRKTGGNSPSNLITLCEECHKAYHAGNLKLDIKRQPSYKDATFMGIMRWTFYNRLKKKYPNVSMTYGYITKKTRVENQLSKEHYVDARCISGNPVAEPLGYYFQQKKVRCHNRQIHKANILKGGKKKLNQAPYIVKGFRLFDKVLYAGQECFIFGRRNSGYFDLRLLDGTKISPSANYKKLNLLKAKNSYLQERRNALPPTSKEVGFRA